MNEVWILNKQILVDVEEYIVHENGDESVDGSNRVGRLLLSDVVRIRRINCQSLHEFDVVNTANECVLALANTAAEPEHANQCVNSSYEEKEFA